MSESGTVLSALRARHRAAAEALARVSAEELAALTDEAALERTLSLRLFVGEPIKGSETSGLVEQQALFRRAKQP